MREFENFYTEVTRAVQNALQDAVVTKKEVMKNNSLKLHGISVKAEGKMVAPTIYVDGFFKKFSDNEMTFDEVVKEIVKTAKTHQIKGGSFEQLANDFTDFNIIKGKIVFQLVNAEKNVELLENAPHRKLLDLAVIYKVLVESNHDGLATITVLNEHAKSWGVNENDLFEIAEENTKRLLPPTVTAMSKIMLKMFEEDGLPSWLMEDMLDKPAKEEMYVITNDAAVAGATGILYTDTLNEIANMVNSNVYVLPSSIHEVIAISTEMVKTPDELTSMVREVNATQVKEDEQLSDSVYLYDRNSGKLCIA